MLPVSVLPRGFQHDGLGLRTVSPFHLTGPLAVNVRRETHPKGERRQRDNAPDAGTYGFHHNSPISRDRLRMDREPVRVCQK